MSKALILIAPGLLALSAEKLAAMRSLATLAVYAGVPCFEPRGIAAALFASLGVPEAVPIGPLASLGAGRDTGDDYVLCADPVHLAVDRDTVVLVQTVDDLSASDADALIQMLNRHFAEDDLRFEAARPDAWFVRRRQPADIVTTPPDVARGRKLLASMPRGTDGGKWKRWQNEIEMLLHEHAINSIREARGEAVVSGVWFWGGGRLGDVGALPVAAVTASPGRLGDLARGIARQGHGVATPMQAGDDLTQAVTRADAVGTEDRDLPIAVLVVLPPITEPAATFESYWMEPALDQLARRRVDPFHLIADGHGATVTWTARPPGYRQRITARMMRRPFEVPALPDA
ncbi:MAG: hypothetical protein M3R40_01190 [Pseudomonadota bacterium]|nr:hypothetical protein [Pseudomonadota bacterium]